MNINKINSRQIKISDLDLSEGTYRIEVDERIISESGIPCKPYTGYFVRGIFKIYDINFPSDLNRAYSYPCIFYTNWKGSVKIEIWDQNYTTKIYNIKEIECDWGRQETTINIPDNIASGAFLVVLKKHDDETVLLQHSVNIEDEEITALEITPICIDNNIQLNISYTCNFSSDIVIELVDIVSYNTIRILKNTDCVLGSNIDFLDIIGVSSGQYRVKIYKSNEVSVNVISEILTVFDPKLQLTSPNIRGEHILVKNSNHNITWFSQDISNVTLSVIKNNIHLQPIDTVPNSNSYLWAPPLSLIESDDYGIRVEKSDNAGIMDESDEKIIIVDTLEMPAPIVTVANNEIIITKSYPDENSIIYYSYTDDQTIPPSVDIGSDIYTSAIPYHPRARIKAKCVKFGILESEEIYIVLFTLFSDDEDIYSDNQEFYNDHDNTF